MKWIYFDYNATTPMDKEVIQAMAPYWSDQFGNSMSQHGPGWTADRAVEHARQQVSQLISCDPKSVFFTSGATESNNWLLKSFCENYQKENPGKIPHILSASTEHASVLHTLEYLAETKKADVTFIKPNIDGTLSVELLKSYVQPNTALVCAMWVQNEVGSINPIHEITHWAHENKIQVFSDATQAVGKIPVSLAEIKVDFITFSGHKFYGPKGVGALIVNLEKPHLWLTPLLHGGGHERGLRSGTVNTPAIVGMGKACELCYQNLEQEYLKVKSLRDLLAKEITSLFPSARINTPMNCENSPNTLNITFLDCRVPATLTGLAVSRTSACQSSSQIGSSTLANLGMNSAEIESTLRLSVGRYTTETEIKEAVVLLKKYIQPKAASTSFVSL